jgi:hypothetical protein
MMEEGGEKRREEDDVEEKKRAGERGNINRARGGEGVRVLSENSKVDTLLQSIIWAAGQIRSNALGRET